MQLFVYPLPPPTLACVPILWCPPIRIAVCALVFFFFFFFGPILFWNTSQRLSPVVTTSRYICET
jgi:hypothetical protein